MKKVLIFLLAFVLLDGLFFKQYFIEGKLPIPSDTIVGLYHPYRDFYARLYPRGIPFKNFLVTDPVRQQYPWKELVVSKEKEGRLPLWNSYNFSGTPLLANVQSGAFYPFNLPYFFLSQKTSWAFYIILTPLFAGIFMFLYLRNLNLTLFASFFASVVWAFCGFSIAWLEWGNILHTAIWLPLVLLSIDKAFYFLNDNKFSKKLTFWTAVFVFSMSVSFFAGHLQTFFYLFVFSASYCFFRWIEYKRNKTVLLLFAFCFLLFTLIVSVQLVPTIQFILNSARSLDQSNWQKEGWFIPWQHLIQFIAPDFFGNPATLNYWGIWNYGEFIGYIGIVPLLFTTLAASFKRDRLVWFFSGAAFLAFVFALQNPVSSIPFALKIPFLSTAQPTRLLFVIDFCLSVLAGFGFDYFIRQKNKKILYVVGLFGIVFVALWGYVTLGKNFVQPDFLQNLVVAKNNLILPTGLFIVTGVIFALYGLIKKTPKTTLILCCIIVAITVFDLFRFGLKFNPFTPAEYLFPHTSTISFLQSHVGNYRIMSTDSRIFPPNFSAVYKLQSIDGYDPLYLQRYAELIAASQRNRPDISEPFGFNRIIAPHNFDSRIIDLLGVKYVLSLSDLTSPKLTKVFQEGQTRIYENKNALPRAFFIEQVKVYSSKKEVVWALFDPRYDLGKTAFVELPQTQSGRLAEKFSIGQITNIDYNENRIVLEVNNTGNGFLVTTDSYYPTWKAGIDGSSVEIFLTDFNFRGVFVPAGKHRVIFENTLL